jgi:DUF4097 and DUF4098 domain-containing protein YvlB
MRPSRLAVLIVLSLASAALPLAAQRNNWDSDDARWLDECRNGWNGNSDRGRACELRTVPVRLTDRSLEVDGRENGGIHVEGWDGDSVRVTARIQATARDDGTARDLLNDVKIKSDGRSISSDTPRSWGRNESVSVTYMVHVPRKFDLRLEAHNGGIGVAGVTGRMSLETTNGSVSLVEIGGDVRAHTQNGSLNVQLVGTKWDGRGLDAETQNGSVRMAIPSDYAAQIETGTVNGRMSTDFPVTLQGRIGRNLTLPLNGGGAPIRAMTTNGSVSLTRR